MLEDAVLLFRLLSPPSAPLPACHRRRSPVSPPLAEPDRANSGSSARADFQARSCCHVICQSEANALAKQLLLCLACSRDFGHSDNEVRELSLPLPRSHGADEQTRGQNAPRQLLPRWTRTQSRGGRETSDSPAQGGLPRFSQGVKDVLRLVGKEKSTPVSRTRSAKSGRSRCAPALSFRSSLAR